MRRLLVLGLIGCGSPTSETPRPPKPKPVEPASSIYRLPAAAPLPAWRMVCEGGTARTLPAKHAIYDFAPSTLYPVRSGARIEHRSRAGKARTWLHLDEAMSRAAYPLSACWKWASARGAPETTLDIAFTVTPMGKTISHSVVDQSGGSRELVTCLQENLRHVRIDDLSPRTTRMRTRVAFTRVAQPRWRVLPKRPTTSAPEQRPKTCIPVLEDAPIDHVTSPVTYTVDDFDKDRDPPQPGVPVVHLGCHPQHPRHVDKSTIRRAVRSNHGAYQQCYAEAREREPALTGTVTLTFAFVDGATPSSVTSTGAGDAAFHGCLRAAASEIWLAEVTPQRPVAANFVFELGDAIDAPDPDADLAEAVRVLDTAKTDRARCVARANILHELVELAPWIEDARVLAATRDLTTFAAKLHPDDRSKCLVLIEDTLDGIAFAGISPTRNHLHLRWSLLDRMEAVLPIAPHVAWGTALRWSHAATIAMMASRHGEGVAALRAFAIERAPWADLAEQELERYELPLRVQSRSCARN